MDREEWLKELKVWRDKIKVSYNGELYERPELKWAQSNYAQPQMMVEDRCFYDPATGKYTVDKYLDDLQARYGGIDSVLIWPVYPNVGIDNRNQHDLLKDLPGGLAGVKQMVTDFHRRGVHVLSPIMPWETGARDEKVSLAEAMARDFKEAGLDGANGDTMGGVGQEYVKACDALNLSLAFEPEGGCRNIMNVQYDVLSWGYWSYDHIPSVDRFKWLDSRHLTNVCDRWQRNKIAMLQSAFFNGDGFETWENVWGIWNGITPRDAEAIRRVATVDRALADYLISPDWEPHVPTLQKDLFASKFPLKSGTVWQLINRTAVERVGPEIAVPYQAGMRFYDCWNGQELHPDIQGDKATLSFRIEANGFGSILTTTQPTDQITKLMAVMAKLTAQDLSTFSDKWIPLPQTCVEIAPTAPAKSAPDGMILIPAGSYDFKVHGVEIEGQWECKEGVDVQYPWESVPSDNHDHTLAMKSFYIDKYPVTNADFKKFLDATQYHPVDDHNFLKDWSGGVFPAGWDKKPVTWVSLEDARAYAAWAGKRLPHEWEWQYAAQGTDGRLYPWGPTPDAEAIPQPESGHTLRGPTDVDAYPKGASSFGVMDLVNNVWQWTDEYQDTHTRAAILRGGSYYRPEGSRWYFPQNHTLDEHGKYLLMCPGKDRSGTVGFRCVKDN
jgi:formylglycine-generating enzyme required for sulfatase activity